MAKTYTPVGWQDGEIVTPAKADLTTGIVTPAEVNGTTPVNAENLNHMDNAIKQLYDEGTTSKDIVIGTEEDATEDTKLLIETDSFNCLGTEVVDSLDGNETTMAPSVRSVNKALENIKTTVESIKFADYLESNITSIVSRTRKVNKRVVLEFSLSGNFAPNTNVKIATMPEGFRPNSHTYGTVTFHTGSVNMFVGSIAITSEGNVSVKSSGQASGVFATIVYDVD